MIKTIPQLLYAIVPTGTIDAVSTRGIRGPDRGPGRGAVVVFRWGAVRRVIREVARRTRRRAAQWAAVEIDTRGLSVARTPDHSRMAIRGNVPVRAVRGAWICNDRIKE